METMARYHPRKRRSVDVDHVFKVLLIGDASVGKTSLLLRYCENEFKESLLLSTIGIDYKDKIIERDNVRIRLQIWDTAGQERYRSFSKSFYRGSHGIAVVYDITRTQSFEHCESWLSEIRTYAASSDLVKCIVGNKSDLVDLRTVDAETALNFAEQCGAQFCEVSALNSQGVNEMFDGMLDEMLRRKLRQPSSSASSASARAVKPVDNGIPSVALEATPRSRRKCAC